MPRPLRLQIPDGFYHLTMRGNGGQVVFFTERDHRLFLRLVAKVQDRYGWQMLAYCLMNNHYHLVARTPEPNLAAGMQHLNSLYARKFNRRHGLSGHLWERRYHAEIIDSDSQLKETIRYLALNPVRAHQCMQPADWGPSSYRAMIGLDPAPLFLDLDWIRGQFSSIASLERFVSDGMVPVPSPAPWR
jgi:putative transposase